MTDYIRTCDYCGKTYELKAKDNSRYCCRKHLQAHTEGDQVKRLVDHRKIEKSPSGVITRIKSLQPDRQLLVDQLAKELNSPAIYSGAPSFTYKVKNYTVLRDGTLELPKRRVNKRLLRSLANSGLIDSIDLYEADGISFSTDGFTGRTLATLIFMLASKADLINKSIAIPNAFHIDANLVRDVKKENPDTVADFMRILCKNGGFKAMRGLYLSNGRIYFVGFDPQADKDEQIAHQTLAEMIVHYAMTKKWAKPNTINVTNEKYSFRTWLNSIGMIGEEYNDVRRILLQRLEGNQTYRLPEQKEAFEARRRAMKEPDFVEL